MAKNFDIPFGESKLSALWDATDEARAVVVLAHGSGAGKEHPFLEGFAQALSPLGINVLRFNFPYMDAGKKFPDRAPVAVSVWNTVYDWTQRNLADTLPVFVAGKSFGGRMGSMMVAEVRDVPGLIFLGYPLHAPKTPEKLRTEHLYDITAPMLFLQGTKDPFAQVPLLQDILAQLGTRASVEMIEGGDHSFKTARSGRSVLQDGAQLATPVHAFIDGLI